MKVLAVVLLVGFLAICQIEGHKGSRRGESSGTKRACYDLLKPSNATLFKAIQDLAANQTLFNQSLLDMSSHKGIMGAIEFIILKNATVIGADNLINLAQATTYLTTKLDALSPPNQQLKDAVLARIATCVTQANAQTSVFRRACTFRKCICGDSDRNDSSEG
ncbi:uncharacterized protein LOC135210502 [Macrobrachium nipponense]|uniref:uncharacterized protein LOC135210502 n=1 Tax=Macrobrachium nipponense TaxID=159736 RepID=UPI0030C881A3